MREITLEFLAVSDDQETVKVVTNLVRQSHGQLHCTPNASLASEYIGRRKIDGIILDTAVDRSFGLLQAIRTGKSNKHAVIFVCVEMRAEAGSAISAGANFVLYKPLTEQTLRPVFNVAMPMMEVERRRYFRHGVSTLVKLSSGGAEYSAILSNLSETGMAIRSGDMLMPGTPVDFSFELPNGPKVKGRGEIVWTNSGGNLGILFHFLADAAHRELPTWLAKKDE